MAVVIAVVIVVVQMLIVECLAEGAIGLSAIRSIMRTAITERRAEGACRPVHVLAILMINLFIILLNNLAERAGRPVHVLGSQPVADAALVELVAARGEPG